MDESWDLWFRDVWITNSSFFVVTFLLVDSKKDVEIIMKNTYNWMARKWVRIKESFFHSNKESQSCVMKVLTLCSYRNFKVAYLYIDKSKNHYSWNTHQLYNRLIGELIQYCKENWLISWDETIFFIASRRETKKQLIQNFENDLKLYTRWFSDFRVKIWSPRNEKGLEVVDTLSFAFYKKCESLDSTLYDIIKEKIALEIDFLLDGNPIYNS